MRLSVISKELTSEESEHLQLAVSTLMIEMIRADFIELHKEKKIMHEVLIASMGLSDNDVDKLIRNAEIHSDFTISIQSHTSVINNFFSRNEKKKFLQNLWVLANIDGEFHDLELNLLDEVAKHLGFSQVQLKQLCKNN